MPSLSSRGAAAHATPALSSAVENAPLGGTTCVAGARYSGCDMSCREGVDNHSAMSYETA